MSLASIVQFICIIGEFLVLAQALRYKLGRALPIFVCYLAWNFFSDTMMSPLFPWSSAVYLQLYRVEASVDFVAQTTVLIEIAWKVLRPALAGQGRNAIAALAGTATILALLIWLMTASLTDMPYPYNVLVRLGQTEQILGVVWILALAMVSHPLSLVWKDRLFQVAAGIFAYSLAGVLVIVYRCVAGVDSHGYWLQPLSALAYLGVLLYWIKSFSVQRISALGAA